MDLLPEELLADILRRLPPRPLAVCRSVSKDLRSVIDGRCLLLAVAHRVPRGPRGVFINYVGQDRPYFFSRPAADSAIDADLTFLPANVVVWREVVHHCNGLLLVMDWSELYVCNPATRRWEHLPPPPSVAEAAHAHIAFDPTVSLHYEVFFFAKVPRKPKIPIQPGIERQLGCRNCPEYTDEEIKDLPSSLRDKYDREARVKGLAEWPPSSYVAQVFSSRTGQWEERSYVREDDIAVTLWDVWSDPWARENQISMSYNAPRCNAVYWRGAFYLHCRGGFIMRLSLLEQKYQVIKTPKLDNVFVPPRLDVADFLSQERPYYKSEEECVRAFQSAQKYLDNLKPSMHLGKSVHGIYCTAIRWNQLRVWVLQEPSVTRPMLDWDLKYKVDLEPSFSHHFYNRDNRKELKTPWCLDRGQIGIREAKGTQVCGWDSSDDSGMNVKEQDNVYSDAYNCDIIKMDFLGYHPNKEIAFLGNEDFDGFAYYLESSKFQYLGTFEPVGCCHKLVAATHESFIYTPCVDDLLPNSKDGGIIKSEDIKLEDEGFQSQ